MTQPLPAQPLERGRGALILVLGILSLIMFGLITGIPAWVMGHTDLRRMREGLMESTDEGLTRAGMILGIIGTLLSALAIVFIILIIVGLFSFAGFMLDSASVDAQERAIEAHLHTIARNAQIYRHDRGSYEGYELPEHLRRTDREHYSAQVSPDAIVLRGRATNRNGSIEATLDSDGNLVDWVYTGAFDEGTFEGESTRQRTGMENEHRWEWRVVVV
jgi:hypothetical protein